ncbi:MAG: PAS domain S-box protein, partial [Nitrospiraceae bacterium]|nr:PAS domain S-box protein [Nitrospiraceae bacterium]
MAGPTLKIRLVEDNPADAVSIELLLSEIERQQQQLYRLKTADSLSAGLKAMDDETFDVVLLDFELPDSSGFDTPRRVQERCPEVPIVALTGHSGEEFAARAISLGVQDYLIKGRIVSDLLYRAILYAIERKKSEQMLKNSEERFRAFFELTGVGAFQADPSGRFILVNRSFCKIMGYERDSLLSLSLGDLTYPDDMPAHLKEFGLLLGGDQSQYDTEKRFVHSDGRTVWVHLSLTLLRDAKGRPLRAMGIVQDITGKKSAEEEIRHIADHDALTGLPNRRLFIELTRLEMAQARQALRKAKKFHLADQLRSKIEKKGYVLEDSKKGI